MATDLRTPPALASTFDNRLQPATSQPAGAGPSSAPQQRILVKSGHRLIFLNVDEIEWVEAARNYMCVRVQNETHLLRETMAAMLSRLPGSRFLRVHRSFVVNLSRIREMRVTATGEYELLMRDGKQIPVSRSRRAALLERFSVR